MLESAHPGPAKVPSMPMSLLLRVRHCLAALMLALAVAPASAATFTFAGGTVAGCTRSNTIYTCATLPLTSNTDTMEIGSGYSVNITAAVTFDRKQTLIMSGSARLTSSSHLDIGELEDLQVTGGSFSAGGTFTFGSRQQSMTANVTAASVVIGRQSELKGSVVATGTVTIDEHTKVTGAVAGSKVWIERQASVVGNVSASQSVTMDDHGVVTGDINAPIVEMGRHSEVIGDITANTSIVVGPHAKVQGDVSTGLLTLSDPQAEVTGNATVNHAILEKHSKVEQKIFCRNGTDPNECDCVTNNSTYPVNTANGGGPTCEPATNGSTLSHLLLTHGGNALTCTPAEVTITACANATCTAPHHTGNVSGFLRGNGASLGYFNFSGGSTAMNVSKTSAGPLVLSTSAGAGAGPSYACLDTSANSSSCTLTFHDSGFLIEAPDHVSETSGTKLTIKAVKRNTAPNSPATCVPGYTGAKTVNFTCSYSNPTSGTLAVRLNNVALNVENSPGQACDAAGNSIALNFDGTGTAEATLAYADVGQVNLVAKEGTSMNGNDAFIAAPARLVVSGPDYGLIKAGSVFTTRVKALNAANAWTPNFGKETSTAFEISHVRCQPAGTTPAGGVLASGTYVYNASANAIDVPTTWSEVGSIDVLARTLAGGYLDSTIAASGSTATGASCSAVRGAEAKLGSVGRFIPAYFDIELAINPKPAFYYSGQPIPVTVFARNATGVTTQFFDKSTTLSRQLTFTAVDSNGTAIDAGVGSLSAEGGANTIATDAFRNGTIDSSPTVATPAPAFNFAKRNTAPTAIRLRVTDTDGASSKDGIVATNPPTGITPSEPTVSIRSGRMRMFNRFGSSRSPLALPITVEYYTGKSWITNADDNFTVVKPGSIALSRASGDATVSVVTASSQLTMVAGRGQVMLNPTSGQGTVNVALNLGATNLDTACLSAHPNSTPSLISYLRGPNGSCTATLQEDPRAQATFGVQAPENRRIIHVREIFN